MALSRATRRRRTARHRRGLTSLEVVMTTAVMLPIAFALLVLGVKLATTAYQVTAALVAWPFL